MGLLDKVMDDNGLKKNMMNIHSYLSKHKDQIEKIFDLVHTDLNNIFKDVQLSNEVLLIILNDPSDIQQSLNIVNGAITKHTKDILPDISFDVLVVHYVSNKIYIKKRQ